MFEKSFPQSARPTLRYILPEFVGQYGYVPLEQIAKISYRAEDGVIWRRDLKPTITVRGSIIKEQPMMQLKKYIIN